MTTLVGLVDRPIPEDSADHTLGYTRSEWLRGEDIVGARIDFEHGRGELKQDDRPLGHVTRTFISNEADGDWLAVEGQLIRQDPLVDALRSHTKKHGMGLSIRYNTRINGQNVITGKQCKEISLHRRPHHAGAIVTVCQGKDDPTGSTAEIQQSIQHLRFPDTKTLPPDSSTVPHFHLPKSLPSSRMATPATAMDTTLPPPAGTPPPANPPAAAEKTTQEPAKSDAVARAEMAIQLAEIQKQNALLQQQVAEANAKRQADEKAAQDKAAKEQTERTDKRRTDFMAAKDHHSALGINMEDPATKALWESVFTQDTGAGIYNAMMTAFKERETLMKTNADTQEKLKSTSQALDVYEKRLKPNNYVPNGQQALPSNASELAERAKNDPAIQNMKVFAQKFFFYPYSI